MSRLIVPKAPGFRNYGGTPRLDRNHRLTRRLICDIVDSGTSITQLVAGGPPIAPPFDIYSYDQSGGTIPGQVPIASTPYGPVKDYYTLANNYGFLGMLQAYDNTFNGGGYQGFPIPTEPMRAKIDLLNSGGFNPEGVNAGAGWTLTTTYIKLFNDTPNPGGAYYGGMIFGRPDNAMEVSNIWAVCCFSHGATGGNVCFNWSNSGTTNSIEWSTGAPATGVGSLVTLFGRATQTGSGSTMDFYGSVNFAPPVFIGTATGQSPFGYPNTNSYEDQVMWGGVIHIDTGQVSNGHPGYVYRGSAFSYPLSYTDMMEIARNPDCYRLWPGQQAHTQSLIRG
jgi:hypothetical protein